jgi:hypothetical protein
VQAVETGNANQINQTSAAGGKALQRSLASRGLAQSGAAASGSLSTELGRESNLAANSSNAAQLQLNQNQSFLSDALMAAFASQGTTNAQQGTTASQSSGSGTSTGFGVGVGGATGGGGAGGLAATLGAL